MCFNEIKLSQYHSSTHSSCRACGARYLPSCCSPASSWLAPSPCTSSGSVRGTPPAATKARSGLNGCIDNTMTSLECPYTSRVSKQFFLCQLGKRWFTYDIGDHDSWYIMSDHGKYKTATAHHHTELGKGTRKEKSAPSIYYQILVFW